MAEQVLSRYQQKKRIPWGVAFRAIPGWSWARAYIKIFI